MLGLHPRDRDRHTHFARLAGQLAAWRCRTSTPRRCPGDVLVPGLSLRTGPAPKSLHAVYACLIPRGGVTCRNSRGYARLDVVIRAFEILIPTLLLFEFAEFTCGRAIGSAKIDNVALSKQRREGENSELRNGSRLAQSNICPALMTRCGLASMHHRLPFNAIGSIRVQPSSGGHIAVKACVRLRGLRRNVQDILRASERPLGRGPSPTCSDHPAEWSHRLAMPPVAPGRTTLPSQTARRLPPLAATGRAVPEPALASDASAAIAVAASDARSSLARRTLHLALTRASETGAWGA